MDQPLVSATRTVPPLVWYRKYRSRDFTELVGQRGVVVTLQNALRAGRLAHAYLLSGPRGTGKTSTARILAKAVNCLGPTETRPCNQCSSCRLINQGQALDLMEIDAASNTGVDDVRILREIVQLAPSSLRYKVYIIDECHMLSQAAFNALLKTLEEPPAWVLFLLATTDAHRMPPTVASRCQVLEFRRIGLSDLIDQLRLICGQEKITVEDQALEMIARWAGGGLRDAISLLDQMAGMGNGRVSELQVQQHLGCVSRTALVKWVDLLLAADVAEVLRSLQRFIDLGADPTQLQRQLVGYLRSLMWYLAQVTGEDLGLSETEVAVLARQSGSLHLALLPQWIRIFTTSDMGSQRGLHATLGLETALVQACLLKLEGSDRLPALPLPALPLPALPLPALPLPALPLPVGPLHGCSIR